MNTSYRHASHAHTHLYISFCKISWEKKKKRMNKKKKRTEKKRWGK